MEMEKMKKKLNRPQAGVNALMCPKCQGMNDAARAQVANGTLFVPVSLELKAQVESGVPAVVKTSCHERGHEVSVELTN
jgi:hypothetical protein